MMNPSGIKLMDTTPATSMYTNDFHNETVQSLQAYTINRSNEWILKDIVFD